MKYLVEVFTLLVVELVVLTTLLLLVLSTKVVLVEAVIQHTLLLLRQPWEQLPLAVLILVAEVVLVV